MKFRVGKLELAFVVLLPVYIGLISTLGPGKLATALKLSLSVLAAVIFIRLSNVLVRRSLWWLRNRLITAYLFIALVPVVLITTLLGLGAYLVAGQFSSFLVTSELERRLTSLRGAMEFLSRANDPDGMRRFLGSRFPHVEITVDNPVVQWQDVSGLVLKDGLLYGWAHYRGGQHTATAMFPITRELLGDLAPDLCECSIVNLSNSASRPNPLHASFANETHDPSHNRMPPAVNFLDVEILSIAPLPVALLDRPGVTQKQWLTVWTRPSALLRTVFAQKVDFANDMIPALFYFVAILFLIAELIALQIGISITRTITGAVHNLYQGTLRVTGGDFSHRIPADGKDQLAELASSFNQMTGNLQRLVQVEKEKERLSSELEIASEVQNQLYPKRVPDSPSLRITGLCQPARMVSGDYYDYQKLGQTEIALAIGDVAGKGISAALLMATVQSAFRTQLRGSLELAAAAGNASSRSTLSTSAVVAKVNEYLHAYTSPEKFTTFFFGVYEEKSNILTYTNGGHLPPILVRKGAVSRLDVNGTVVGAFPLSKYDESQLRLEPGDLLVFFTDGITEPENAYGEMFGEERLEELVSRGEQLDSRAIVSSILQAVRQWTGSDELQDDMTLLLVRRV
ncbi:MAG TPA: SpoIIE family protein phosphatase [Bryobacteraceae bacterium]|nr:SpoIIE family protein phosphatase [Bryobacteraceae bacterium]